MKSSKQREHKILWMKTCHSSGAAKKTRFKKKTNNYAAFLGPKPFHWSKSKYLFLTKIIKCNSTSFKFHVYIFFLLALWMMTLLLLWPSFYPYYFFRNLVTLHTATIAGTCHINHPKIKSKTNIFTKHRKFSKKVHFKNTK